MRRPPSHSPSSHTSPARTPGQAPRPEANSAPSQWGRRLARAVGARFGVAMVSNRARNEGEWQGREVAIKCAKSTAPPISVLVSSLDRLDEVWAVFVMPEGHAEVWQLSIAHLRRHGHFTRPGQSGKAPARVEIRRRKVIQTGQLIGQLDASDVEACHIP